MSDKNKAELVSFGAEVPKPLVDTLRSLDRFLLVAHIGLDGDHLGSMLALHEALESMGKEVISYLPERLPESYAFLPGLEKLSCELPTERVDAVITLECPTVRRLPKGLDLRASAPKVLNLDHHPDNELYGDLNWVDPAAAALGEMIFDLIEQLGVPMTHSMAIALYVAVLTDTGSFQYSRVTPGTHRRLASMLEFELPTDEISRSIYRQSRPEVLRLLGSVLASVNLAGNNGSAVAWGEIPKQSLDEFGVAGEETQFFVDDIDRVRDAEVVALFRETGDGHVKVSLRSRRWPINQVAAQFGGGGHARAAGCVVAGGLGEVRSQVIEAVVGELEAFQSSPQLT